jgi:hypothetical protein
MGSFARLASVTVTAKQPGMLQFKGSPRQDAVSDSYHTRVWPPGHQPSHTLTSGLPPGLQGPGFQWHQARVQR